MITPHLRSGPSLLWQHASRKRESAPGKVRQLKESADRQDSATLHHQAWGCKTERGARRSR